MKLNLQHLQRQIELDSGDIGDLRQQIEQVTEQIIEQIESLNKIATDFSRFGRPVRGEFTDIEINGLIRSISEFYEPDTKGAIRHDLFPKDLYVHGSAEELRRTLINLIKNSFEAFTEKGELVIRSYRRGTSVYIELTDNGVGIPEQDRDKIFVPNFSTKSSGTGLGLAISKQTIEAHNGSIHFRSEEGAGTTFVIKIPVLDGNH